MSNVENILNILAETQLKLREVEDRYILAVLKKNGGNKAQTGRALGLDRRTLYRRLQAMGHETALLPELRENQDVAQAE